MPRPITSQPMRYHARLDAVPMPKRPAASNIAPTARTGRPPLSAIRRPMRGEARPATSRPTYPADSQIIGPASIACDQRSQRSGKIKCRAPREDLRDAKRRNDNTAIRQRGHALAFLVVVQSQRASTTATSMPASWAAINVPTPLGAIPANVLEIERTIVTAGLANEVEAVNQ